MESRASWILVGAGIVLVAVGLLWPVLSKLGLGRLPGDLVIEREGFRLSIPLATMLLVSVLLTVLVNLLLRR